MDTTPRAVENPRLLRQALHLLLATCHLRLELPLRYARFTGFELPLLLLQARHLCFLEDPLMLSLPNALLARHYSMSPLGLQFLLSFLLPQCGGKFFLTLPGGFPFFSLPSFSLHSVRNPTGPLGGRQQLHGQHLLFLFLSLLLLLLFYLLDNRQDIFDQTVPKDLLVGILGLLQSGDEIFIFL